MLEVGREVRVVEARAFGHHESREAPEAAPLPVERGLGIGELEAQALVHVLIEVPE